MTFLATQASSDSHYACVIWCSKVAPVDAYNIVAVISS